MNRVALQAAVTLTTATDSASLDISAMKDAGNIPLDWTIKVRVKALDGTARLALHDSVNAFSAELPGPAWSLSGKLNADTDPATGAGPQQPVEMSVKKAQFPSLRFGVSSAVLRINLAEITGSVHSITFEAWVEY